MIQALVNLIDTGNYWQQLTNQMKSKWGGKRAKIYKYIKPYSKQFLTKNIFKCSFFYYKNCCKKSHSPKIMLLFLNAHYELFQSNPEMENKIVNYYLIIKL